MILYDPTLLANRFGPTLDTTFIAQPTLEEPLRKIGHELIAIRRKRGSRESRFSTVTLGLLHLLVWCLSPIIKLFSSLLRIIEKVLVVNKVNLTVSSN